MSSIEEATATIFSVFNEPTWKSQKIKTLPPNFVPGSGDSEYIRIHIITSPHLRILNALAGILKVEIYTPNNSSIKRAVQIAGLLDSHFKFKTIGKMQFEQTSLTHNTAPSVSNEKEEPTFFKSVFQVNFSYFEVN